jgi:hypothetical protein
MRLGHGFEHSAAIVEALTEQIIEYGLPEFRDACPAREKYLLRARWYSRSSSGLRHCNSSPACLRWPPMAPAHFAAMTAALLGGWMTALSLTLGSQAARPIRSG